MRVRIWVLLLLTAMFHSARAVERISVRDVSNSFEASATTSQVSELGVSARLKAKTLLREVPFPYAGYWAADRRACLNPDSDERMAIDGDTIDWYETHCTIKKSASEGRQAWTLDLACRGEGQRIKARARVWLPAADKLVMDNGPIGPARRQRYMRCKPR